MDFRTDKSSWFLVLLMMVIAVVINPWIVPDSWDAISTLKYAFNILLYPFIATALATIPVLIVCWFMKIEPDLDYSMRVGFVGMLILLIRFFMG